MPNLVGMDAANAQLLPLMAGFTNLGIFDASGQDRDVDDGKHWTVCRQSLPPGSIATGSGPPLTMYVMHTAEGC